MKRLLIVVALLLSSSIAYAQHGHSGPLCPNTPLHDCVVPNWGQTQPDDDGAFAPLNNAPLAHTTSRSGMHMAVAMQSVAAMPSPNVPLKTVISPEDLFKQETLALTSALKRARFSDDGEFVSGRAAVVRAAAVLARRAGNRYTLTLYIKVPTNFKPDDTVSLDKKVRSVNKVLESPEAPDTEKPST